MITRGRNWNGKRKPILSSDEETEQTFANHQESELDEDDIEISNSQLSNTLSTSFNPPKLMHRDQEKKIISSFIKNCIETNAQESNRVLYISGVPGVGKTVATKEIIKSYRKLLNRKKVMFRENFNAMSLPNPPRIFSLMCETMYGNKIEKGRKLKLPAYCLQQFMESDEKVKIVLIDEIDFLLNKEQSVLYTLFEWCSLPTTKLCLIVIANSMDFPEKLKGKISSRMGNSRIVFRPYSQKEVQSIVEERLAKSNRFTKDAVLFACKKMSSYTSDVRKILDVLLFSVKEKNEGKIEIEDIIRNWRVISQENGTAWQEDFPEFYRNIMNAIKQEGGVALINRITLRASTLTVKYSECEIGEGLHEMQEMGIVKLKEKKVRGLNSLEATLLKI